MRENPAPEDPVGRLDDVGLGDVLGDHVAHALRAGLGREGEPPCPHAGDLPQQIVVEPVGAQRRHRERDLLGRQLGHRRLHQRRHAGVVGHRQRRQRRLVVAALLDPLDQRVDDGHRIALPHRPVDHPRLAEAAPLGAAARHLDRHAIEDRLGVRQRRVVGERELVDVRHQHAARAGRHARIAGRADHQQAALFVELRGVELGDVERIFLGQPAEPLAPRDPRPAQLGRLAHQRRQRLLRLADEEGVDEGGQRLGVRGRRAAGDDQRRPVVAVRRAQRDPRQVQDGQHVGVGQLVLQREADHVELAHRRRRLQRHQRQPARAQLGLAVEPGREHALAGEPVGLVEDAVQDLRPQVRHPDLVDVGEGQADPGGHRRRVLARLLVLAADVARRLFDLAQERSVRVLEQDRWASAQASTPGQAPYSLPWKT